MDAEFIASQRLAPAGTHRESDLSDVRRAAPDRLRVILRRPGGSAGRRTSTRRAGETRTTVGP